MGEIILTMQVSLDGIVSDEHLWMTLSREILEDYLDYYQTIDTIIVGRNSYGSLAEYWSRRRTHPMHWSRPLPKR